MMESSATEKDTKFAELLVNELVTFKSQNTDLQNRLEKAEKAKRDAEFAFRHARRVSEYLEKKKASLEKKRVATKWEKRAQDIVDQVHSRCVALRAAIKKAHENGEDAPSAVSAVKKAHSQGGDAPSVVSTADCSYDRSLGEFSSDDEPLEDPELSLADKLCLGSLVLVGVVMAMTWMVPRRAN